MPTKKFKPGKSGNPKGRPKGSGIAGELRKAIAADMPDIIKAIIDKAKDGDTQAAGLLLARICPPLKAEAQTATVKGMATGTLTERATAALNAAAKGNLPPDTAASLVQAVGALARVAELDELERRIQALETQND